MLECVFFLEDEQHGSAKKTRYSYYVTLESESPLPSSEDDESIYTVQGDETGESKS